MKLFNKRSRNPSGGCRSLRCLLIIHFTSATLLPLLVFAILSYALVTHNMKNRITADNRLTAATIERQISSNLSNALNAASWISTMTAEGEFAGRSFARMFEDSLSFLPYFEQVIAADINGEVFGVIPFSEQQIGTSVANHQYFRAIREHTRPYWSGTFFSSISHSTSVVCAVPLNAGVLAAHVNLDWLDSMADSIMQEGERTILITDRNGAVITYKDQELVERKRNLSNLPPVRQVLDGSEGTFDFTFQGERYLCYAMRIDATGWPLLVLRPYTAAFNLQRDAALLLVAVMILSLFLGLTLSYVTGERLLAPLNRLADAARTIASGDYSVSPTADFTEIHSVSTAFAEMSRQIEEREEALHSSIYEKDLLVMEIHHRVKNNLQLVMSLLSLKQSTIADHDQRSSLADSITHIYSIAQVHEQLYHHRDFTSIDFFIYMDSLIAHLANSSRNQHRMVRFQNRINSLELGIDTAIPCGLILSELITNSLQHAFSPEEEGTITIEGFREGDTVHVAISDNGSGFPEEHFSEGRSLGFQIVHVLTEQLKGDIGYENGNGSYFTLSFKG